MNNLPVGRKATSALSYGDRFTYRGEVATFVAWREFGHSRPFGASAIYKSALVFNGDNAVVVWSLNMAGSVEMS